jgi:hypothetical protein
MSGPAASASTVSETVTKPQRTIPGHPDLQGVPAFHTVSETVTEASRRTVSEVSGPFAPLLGGAALPAPLRAQFLGERAVLSGELDRVWHRPRWIAPLLALLARWDVLFPDTGCGIPAELRITPLPGDARAWSRRFRFARERRFDAVMVWDAGRQSLIELTGPFELRWQLQFVAPSRLEIRTAGAALSLRGHRVPLPPLLVPDVLAVEDAVGPSRIHVELTVGKWPFGAFFGYSGTFDILAP